MTGSGFSGWIMPVWPSWWADDIDRLISRAPEGDWRSWDAFEAVYPDWQDLGRHDRDVVTAEVYEVLAWLAKVGALEQAGGCDDDCTAIYRVADRAAWRLKLQPVFWEAPTREEIEAFNDAHRARTTSQREQLTGLRSKLQALRETTGQ